MLGHLAARRARDRAGRARPASCSSTPAASSTGPRRSRSRRSSSRSSARSAARSTASSSRAAWSRSTARELAREIPEVDAFVGLDELENAPAAAAGLPTLPRFTDKPLATRLYDERVAARPLAASGLRVPEGRRGLRQPLHVLHDPPDARPASAAGRSRRSWPRRASLEAQGVSELVLISQDTTRYGEDLGMGRRRPRRASSRRCSRETSLSVDPLPLRLPEDARRLRARR